MPAPALPAEFSHPAVQALLRQGTTRGYVQSENVRTALETAQVPQRRMKAVLRALDEHGIEVRVDEPTSKRAVAAATATRRSSATATATRAKPASKKPTAETTAATKPAKAAKAAAKPAKAAAADAKAASAAPADAKALKQLL